MAENASNSQIARDGYPRRFSVAMRIAHVRALLICERKQPLTWRVNCRARRFGIAQRTLWRWIARFRTGGADALRDSFRRDMFTRRARSSDAAADVRTNLTSLGAVMLGDRFIFRTADLFDSSIGRKPDFEGKQLVVVGFMPTSYASRVMLRAPDGASVLLPLEIVEKFLATQRTPAH